MQAATDTADLGQQLAAAARDGDVARLATLLDRGANCDAKHALGESEGLWGAKMAWPVGRSAVYWAALGGTLGFLPNSKRSC